MDELEDKIIRSGHKDKNFRTIYNHYSPFIWRVIFRTINGNRVASEEIMQTTFIIVHKSIKKFKFKSSFSSWLYRIAWNESIRYMKKESLKLVRETGLDENVSYGEKKEFNEDDIKDKLSILNEEQRFILIGKEIDGFSFDELSKITGKSSGSLRTLLSRTKEQLRERFKNE